MSRTEPGLLRRLQYLAEYAALRALGAAIGLLPEWAAVRAGATTGWLSWLVCARRRRIARRNIERAMPGEYTAAEIRQLVREVFIGIGLTAVENIWMRGRATRENIEQRVPLDGIDSMTSELQEGRAVIGSTPHMGNWELLGGRMAVALGRVNALARPVNNPNVREYTTRLRENLGITVLSTRNGVRPMIAALRRKETLAVLIDQHVNRASVETTFFGRPAATTAVVASLALRFDLPAFIAFDVRDGRSFKHHAKVVGPIELVRTGDRKADVLANTQMLNDKTEEIIRRHPEQWLWTHRRWKLADRLEKGSQKEQAENVG